jgi:mercuric ion transport protein
MSSLNQSGAESKKTVITAATAGGVIAAFLASLCCVGPLVLAALGVGVGATGFLASTAGALKALLPYRPFFIGLTALLLGVAFYMAYRTPKTVCAPGTSCGPGSVRSQHRAALWVVTALALALILAPYWLGL